jgi:hypothetical protein
MLIADGGGGGTDWSSMDVPTMWALVANQDTTAHYEVLTGWQKSYELVIEHMSQVQNYRDNLATAWPPEKSPASAAYVAQLDNLITHLQKTYDAAIANHTAFAGATLSLSLSRNDLKKIYDTYVSNQGKLDTFNAKPKPVQYGKVPVLPPKPPVASGVQEALNTQARVLMSKLSTDLVQAQMSFTAPPKFVPPVFIDHGKEAEPNPAFTPPPVPAAIPTDSGSGSSSSRGTTTHSTPGSAHTFEPPATSPTVGVRQPGLVLGGANPPIGTPLPPPTTMPGTPLPAGGGLPNVITQPPILPPPTMPFSPGLGPTSGAVRSLPGEGMGRVMGAGPAGGVKPMPPGGVIGGNPGTGRQSAIGRGSTQRVNPVGGVIRNSGAEPGAGIRGSSTPGQSLTNMGTRAGRRSKSDETATWDPDNPWDTAEGVAPVVLPTTEQRVDPGPAIGLD